MKDKYSLLEIEREKIVFIWIKTDELVNLVLMVVVLDHGLNIFERILELLQDMFQADRLVV